MDTITTILPFVMENDEVTILPSVMENDQVTRITFSWYDYTFFGAMLGLSVFIGIYYGFIAKKQKTAEEYLLGGKEMKIFPISMSLIASHISGITLLAIPADVYRFGGVMLWNIPLFIVIAAITAHVYLPVYFNLQITSTYEYLEKRFDNKTQMFASFLFSLAMFLYLPIVIYIPALAFSAATGYSVHLVAPLVCAICIFYTTIGGLKAVVWTDTMQFTVTLGAVFTVFVMGVRSAGGFMNIIEIARQNDRLNMLDFSFDLTKRDSFWIVQIYMLMTWLSHATANQSCVQKYLALPTLKNAKKTVYYYLIGIAIVSFVSMFTGLIMYAKYAHCDPFSAGIVKKNDQLLPYYVMDVAGSIPGLPGLFIAGVFSSGLSTLSACLNCLAGTMYEDFVCKFISQKTQANSSESILKVLVVLFGVICTGGVFIIERLGGILPLVLAVIGITAGPLISLCTMGVLIPKVNKHGAFYGTIIGLVTTSIIVFTNQYYQQQGVIIYPPKPFYNDECLFNITSPILNLMSHSANSSLDSMDEEPYKPFYLFRLSFFLFGTLAVITCMISGVIISLLTSSKDDPPVHKDLLSPVIHFLLPKETNEKAYYATVELALDRLNGNIDKQTEKQ